MVNFWRERVRFVTCISWIKLFHWTFTVNGKSWRPYASIWDCKKGVASLHPSATPRSKAFRKSCSYPNPYIGNEFLWLQGLCAVSLPLLNLFQTWGNIYFGCKFSSLRTGEPRLLVGSWLAETCVSFDFMHTINAPWVYAGFELLPQHNSCNQAYVAFWAKTRKKWNTWLWYKIAHIH